MPKKEKIKKPRRVYRGVVGFAKLMSPALKLFYYVSIALVLLCGIIALIMVFVNVSVEDMLLPPLMSVHENEYYSITIGNGIRIDAAYDAVSLGDRLGRVVFPRGEVVGEFCNQGLPATFE